MWPGLFARMGHPDEAVVAETLISMRKQWEVWSEAQKHAERQLLLVSFWYWEQNTSLLGGHPPMWVELTAMPEFIQQLLEQGKAVRTTRPRDMNVFEME